MIIGLIHKDNHSCFGISFPDFEGCFSAGNTHAEAVRNGQKAIDLYVQGLRSEHREIPHISTLQELKTKAKANKDLAEAMQDARIVNVSFPTSYRANG